MDLSLLATLKDKVLHAKNISDVWTYFFDHFGEKPGFIALGQRTQDELLELIIAQVGREIFGKPVPVVDLLLTRLAEHKFVHGGCILGGSVASILYFESICTGVMAVALSASPANTRMVRFRGQTMPPRGAPSLN